MSVYLRLVVGPIVVCDIELFATKDTATPEDAAPAQLAGGSGTLHYPDPIPVGEPMFGFTRTDAPSPAPVRTALRQEAE